MSRFCEICKRGPISGNRVARRGAAKKRGGAGKKITGITRRQFLPNLQRIRVLINGQKKRINVCVRCIKSGKVIKAID